MIVFYLCISICIIFIIIILSSIKVEIRNFEIKDTNVIKQMYKYVERKKYYKILDFVNFNVYLKIILLQILPIRIIKINNFTLKKIVLKIMINDLKERKENQVKFLLKKDKQKKQIKKLEEKIKPYLKIEKVNLSINIGLINACATAIVVGILNTVLSIIILKYVTDHSKNMDIKNEDYYLKNKIQYNINPVYSSQLEFNLKSKISIQIPIIRII